MITCPWCGTTYLNFQSNCNNCGGPLAPPRQEQELLEDEILFPPPAPRPVSDRFVWKLLNADGWAVAGGIFAFLGLIFASLGTVLTIALVTAFVGIPFAFLGMVFLLIGGIGFYYRYKQASSTVQVLQQGEPIRGQLTSIERDFTVQVNGRNPWILRYRFDFNDQTYQGKVTTLNDPDSKLRAGSPICVLYLLSNPEQNAMYPHP
jgi:hypothetical protein